MGKIRSVSDRFEKLIRDFCEANKYLHMLNIYYINLDSAKSRRELIEANLAQFDSASVKVHRVPACDVGYVKRNQIRGELKEAEKGCFVSHIKAIEMSLLNDGPALILEDDALLSPQSVSIINNQISMINISADIAFVDLTITDLKSMCILYRMYRRSIDISRVDFLNASEIGFAGAAAYLLTNVSKIKLYRLLSDIKKYDVPYDIMLRNYTADRTLISGFFFPLIATKAAASLNSSIQETGDYANTILHSFSKLMYIDRDVAKSNCLQDLQLLPADFSDETDLIFGKLITAIISKKNSANFY